MSWKLQLFFPLVLTTFPLDLKLFQWQRRQKLELVLLSDVCQTALSRAFPG